MSDKKYSAYHVGSILSLDIKRLRTASFLPSETMSSIKVEIAKVFEPSTLSVVLLVLLCSNTRTAKDRRTAVLKLYDRRFATELRSHRYGYSGQSPWEPSQDADFVHLAKSENAFKYASTTQDGERCQPQEAWTLAQRDLYVYYQCLDFHKHEMQAYDALQDLQGTHILLFYADVLLAPEQVSVGHDSILLAVPGLLIEYIDGFGIRDIAAHAPAERIQRICEHALDLIRRTEDLDVVNNDMRLDNVLVRKTMHNMSEEPSFEVVFIDFALARVRSSIPQCGDAEWTKLNCYADEENALGLVPEKLLMKKVGPRTKKVKIYSFKYTPSDRYRIIVVDGKEFFEGPLDRFPRDLQSEALPELSSGR